MIKTLSSERHLRFFLKDQKWHLFLKLVYVSDHYKMEGREFRHKAIFRNGCHTQFRSAQGITASPIQTFCQTATWNLKKESANSKKCVIISEVPKW